MGFQIPKDDSLTVSRSTVLKGALRKSSAGLKMGFALIILVYVVFALTVVRLVLGVGGGAGIILTQNDTFYGGIIPITAEGEDKQQVLIDRATGHDGSLIDNAKQAFTINPNTAVIEVYAGPTGILTWVKPDIIAVNGKPLPGSMPPVAETERNPEGSPINEKELLHNDYLGLCIQGACNEGEVVLFNEEQVMGVPVFPQ